MTDLTRRRLLAAGPAALLLRHVHAQTDHGPVTGGGVQSAVHEAFTLS